MIRHLASVFLIVALVLPSAAWGLSETERNGDEPPNVLLITAHDLGQHLGSYGVKTVRTPNVDRLAEKGIRFANAYSASGVCTPGRASLLTGTYPQTNGLMGLTHSPWWWSFTEEAKSWHMANIFRQNGYSTYLIGLQHVTQGSVEELGYQNYESRESNAEETVTETVELIEQERADPFFAKVGFTQVHRGFPHGVDSTKGVFIPPYMQDTRVIREDLARFQAEIHYLDQKVGDILHALYERPESARNTIVIFTSEHGIPFPGAKWTVRKAGIEIPLIMYRADSFLSGGKVYQDVISNVDVLPTLLDLVGIGVGSHPQIEGKSFHGYLEGSVDEAPRSMAFSQYTPDMKRDNLSRSVITEKYHLIRYFNQGRSVDYPTDVNPVKFASHVHRMDTDGARPFAQLFDIEKDEYELNNISTDPKNRKVVRQLSRELVEWMRRVDDDLLKGPLETPYYRRAIKDLNEHR